MTMDRYIISVLVANQSGVLTRVSSMFSRRGYNIDSLTVSETTDPSFSRMTITATCDEYTKEQLVKQLSKIFDVKKIMVMKREQTLAKELMLVKINAPQSDRNNIMVTINPFHAKVIDLAPDTMVLELTGDQTKLDAFISLMEQYGIIELCRTGITAMSRGAQCLK